MKRLIFVLLGVALNLACSRAVDQTTSLTLALPTYSKVSGAASTMATSNNGFSFIAITVSGAGMAPYFYTWESHQVCPTCNDSNRPASPTSINLTVPSGDKLIQVLAMSGQGGGGSFYYGDVAKKLNSGSDGVDIMLTSIGSGGTEATVGGRFIRADGSYPTGRLRMVLHPIVNGVPRPKMPLFMTDIVKGYFNIFLTSNMKFSYVMEPSNEILFNEVSLADVKTGLGQSRANYKIPTHYQSGDSSQTSGTMRNPQEHILGFFGPGLGLITTPKVCHPTSGFSANVYSDQYGVNYLSFLAPSPGATQMGPLASSGLNYASCTTANSFNNELFYRPYYANQSEDRAFGFRGPFRYITDSGPGDYILREDVLGYQSDPASHKIKLTWAMLPAITSAEVTGVTVFLKPGYMSDGGGGPFGMSCDQLESQGYIDMGDWLLGNALPFVISGNSTSLPSGFDPAALPHVHAVACAYKDGAGPGGSRYYYSGALKARANKEGSWNATHSISIVPDSFASYFVDATAKKFHIKVINSSGENVASSWTQSYNIWSSGYDGSQSLSLYLDNGSGTAPGSPVTGSTIPAGQTIFWAVEGGTGGNLVMLNISSGSGNDSIRSPSLYVVAHDSGLSVTSDGGYTSLGSTPSPLIRGRCRSFVVTRKDIGATPYEYTIDQSPKAISFSTSGTGYFYVDSQCQGSPLGTDSITLEASEMYKVVYFKPTAVAGAQTISSTLSGFTAATQGSLNFIDEVPTQIVIPTGPSFSLCEAFEISAANAGLQPIPLNFTQNLTVSINVASTNDPVRVYDNSSDCTANNANYKIRDVDDATATSYTFTMSPYGGNGTGKTLYLRSEGPAPSNFDVQATASPIGLSSGSAVSRVVSN